MTPRPFDRGTAPQIMLTILETGWPCWRTGTRSRASCEPGIRLYGYYNIYALVPHWKPPGFDFDNWRQLLNTRNWEN